MRRLLYKTYLRFGIYIKNSDARHLYVFNQAVQQKSAALGLENSKFLVPSGASTDENYSTARDMLRIMTFATQDTFLQSILASKTRDINIMGDNSRKIIVENTVPYTTIGGVFPILASKTGSWGTDWFNLAVVTEINGTRTVGVIMGAATDAERYAAMQELLTVSSSQNKMSILAVTKAPIAIAATIQLDGSYDVLYEKNADEKCNPASLTKLITAMVVMDYIDKWEEMLTYKRIDMSRHTGLVVAGDTLTVEDALYDMLLPSSNQSAQALARFTGKKILQKEK